MNIELSPSDLAFVRPPAEQFSGARLRTIKIARQSAALQEAARHRAELARVELEQRVEAKRKAEEKAELEHLATLLAKYAPPPVVDPSIKLSDIVRIVCAEFRVTSIDIISKRRTADVIRPRQVTMYLAKTITLRSLPEIGRRMGGRDHTTVLHAVRKIAHLITIDGELAEQVDRLKDALAALKASREASAETARLHSAALCAEQGSGAVS